MTDAILLLRPLGGGFGWGPFADALKERLRVIAPLREIRTSTRAMAEDACRALDDAGVSRAHVYGISLGGMVATWLAIDWPERVDRLVLASTLPKGTMLHLTLRRDVRELLAQHPRSLFSSAVYLAAAARHDASKRLGDVRADTLVVTGEHDPLVTRAARRVLQRIPRVKFDVAPRVGHDVSAEAPTWMARRVIDHVLDA